MNENDVTVYDIFKSAFVWQRTGIRPAIIENLRSEGFVFAFRRSESVTAALDAYDQDEPVSAASFVQRFKILRSELYLMQGRGRRK